MTEDDAKLKLLRALKACGIPASRIAVENRMRTRNGEIASCDVAIMRKDMKSPAAVFRLKRDFVRDNIEFMVGTIVA